MRQRIIQLYEQGKRTQDFAAFSGFCVAAVRRVRQQFKARGALKPQTHLCGRKTLLTRTWQVRLENCAASILQSPSRPCAASPGQPQAVSFRQRQTSSAHSGPNHRAAPVCPRPSKSECHALSTGRRQNPSGLFQVNWENAASRPAASWHFAELQPALTQTQPAASLSNRPCGPAPIFLEICRQPLPSARAALPQINLSMSLLFLADVQAHSENPRPALWYRRKRAGQLFVPTS